MLHLNDLVDNVEKMLRRLLGEEIDFVTRLDPSLWAVKADPGQLEQVLMNLAVNGRDAMSDRGELTIRTRNAEIDVAFATGHPGLVAGHYVALEIRDNGTGMDAATKLHLFEPFFTTKGKGTGLGLSTVYGIVKQSGGYIDVVSELGKGATFTVYLPRVREAVEAAPMAARLPAMRQGTETVLLAEDDPGVRKIVAATLARQGYAVLEAQNGAEALRVAANFPGPIDLLVTDVVMPEMGGSDVSAGLAGTRPHMRVLYMSGYTEDEVFRRGIIEQGCTYLKKPFNLEDFLRKVRSVLEMSPVGAP